MKTFAVLLALSAVAGADDIIPQALPKNRYAETMAKSPFVLETKSAELPGAEKINPFQNLFLRGIGKADGKDYVLIQRLGEERPMRFIGNDPGPDDLSVQTVRIGNTFRETRVVLKKGAETGEIGFKEDTLNSPPPAAAGPPRGGVMPGQFPKPGATMPPQMPAVRPPQTTSIPQPVAQPVPRPQGGVPLPVNNAPQTSGGSRGRLRVINN